MNDKEMTAPESRNASCLSSLLTYIFSYINYHSSGVVCWGNKTECVAPESHLSSIQIKNLDSESVQTSVLSTTLAFQQKLLQAF